MARITRRNSLEEVTLYLPLKSFLKLFPAEAITDLLPLQSGNLRDVSAGILFHPEGDKFAITLLVEKPEPTEKETDDVQP